MMIALSPADALLANLAGFFGGMIVSLLAGFLLLRWDTATPEGSELEADHHSTPDDHHRFRDELPAAPVKLIVVACDAGMGSSAMGSSILRDKLHGEGLDVDVRNSKIEAIPPGADLIITHTQLSERARNLHDNGRSRFMTITNFIERDQYDDIVDYVARANAALSTGSPTAPDTNAAFAPEILKASNVQLNGRFSSAEEAIEAAGRILVREGYVQEAYIPAMQERERLLSVYVGNNVAIPHGTQGSGPLIIDSGVAVVQVPDGVRFGENIVYVLFGIAGAGDDHLQILSRIAKFCSEPTRVQQLREARSESEVVRMLTEHDQA